MTLTLRPNRAWAGFDAGQFVAVGVEIDGVRRTRTYSPASSAHRAAQLELTVTEHPGGLVSGHLLRAARAGADRASRRRPGHVHPAHARAPSGSC